MTAPLNLILIGCGRIAHVHAERLRQDPRARVVGLFDPDHAAAERLRQEHLPSARVAASLAELLQGDGLEGGLQGAVICTPTTCHHAQVLACRKRGLAVLCEKPLADTRERIVELIQATAAGPLFTVAYQRRYSSLLRTLRREVLSGRWGAVRAVHGFKSEDWQQTQCLPGMWRDDPLLNPGGFLGDAGSHTLDAVFYVTGLAPRAVTACSNRCGSRVEVSTSISARFENDALLTLGFIGNAQLFRDELIVSCERADFVIRGNELWMAHDNREEPCPSPEPDTNPTTGWLDTLTSGTPNLAPAACALPVFEFTQAALEAARTGREVLLK